MHSKTTLFHRSMRPTALNHPRHPIDQQGVASGLHVTLRTYLRLPAARQAATQAYDAQDWLCGYFNTKNGRLLKPIFFFISLKA